MKKITILTISLLLAFSMFYTAYGESTYLRAKFTEKTVTGTNFKEVTIEPYRYQNGSRLEDAEDTTYYIYLPTGYLVLGKSASFVADSEGEYPFTVYYGNYKKTFVYTVDGIDGDDSDSDDDDDIYFSYELQYDYEKKQVLFHMDIDKLRTVTTPEGTKTANEVNYYISKLTNSSPYEFKITIDDETFAYKAVKQGEFYLLIEQWPLNYDNYSTLVEYKGYNFTNNKNYSAYPSKDIYEDNGNYEALVKSSDGTSQSLFVFDIDGIDFRRPEVDVDFLDDNTFHMEAEDDFGLDYLITFDGKYVPVKNGSKEFTYTHSTAVDYNGEYIFTVVDKAGNRTVATVKLDSKKTPKKHKLNLDVHNFDNTSKLFKNVGLPYDEDDDDEVSYKSILPAYMNGSSLMFNPDSPITRGEMITVFCRLNDLPYDRNAYLKTKFTDIENHWARDYIAMGSAKKYVSGYKDKTYKPDGYVTRAEFSQMLTKISTYKTMISSIPASSNYSYLDISGHWAESEIIKISSRNLLGSSGNYFYPDRPITRAEVVHAVNRLYGYNPSGIELNFINSVYKKYYSFKDIEKHKYYSDIVISVVGMYREIIK
ncbi:MAG: S-layer homology domain-containing protein [Sedimentibacter sp.]|uniref:S-layer homology domain-containing protein n=1 Tax=Sedimentibacter sp. TaxID=1960295 RepID=UPI0031593F1A